MISDNITKESILKAIEKIDTNGIPKKRLSTKYNIRYMGKLYPPKYTISLANLYENGKELDAVDFSGGREANSFLIELGFEIVGCDDTSKADVSHLRIATITIQTPFTARPANKKRTFLLKEVVAQIGNHADIILFPAGFYYENANPVRAYNEIEKVIRKTLVKENLDIVVCLGQDGRDGKDQIGIAVNKHKILSIGRKFYPTDDEAEYIDLADNYLSLEENYSRIFEMNGKKFYVAVCYDGFGIRKKKLSNPDVDAILNLVHGFYPIGQDGSGEVYFAKYSFAGSSKQWGCPTFGAAVFFEREIPDKWPTGVLWNQGEKSVQEWRYTDNPVVPHKVIEVLTGDEKAVAKIFLL